MVTYLMDHERSPNEVVGLVPRRPNGCASGARAASNAVLGGNMVLALNQAARILPSRYVTEPDIVR